MESFWKQVWVVLCNKARFLTQKKKPVRESPPMECGAAEEEDDG